MMFMFAQTCRLPDSSTTIRLSFTEHLLPTQNCMVKRAFIALQSKDRQFLGKKKTGTTL